MDEQRLAAAMDEATAGCSPATVVRMADERDAIVELLVEADEPLSRRAIEDEMGMSSSTTKRRLKELREAGRVERVGRKRGARYQATGQEGEDGE